VIVKGFKKHYISHKMNQMENEEEVWKLGSEHESVRNEYETEDRNCEDNGDRWTASVV
jgi:hypothetical protein